MTQHTIRVVVPYHLQVLAKISSEISLQVEAPVTHDSVVTAIELAYPALRGTIRDQVTQRRRPLLRYFVCSQDVSHEPADTLLPEAVLSGDEPFIIWGAIAGG